MATKLGSFPTHAALSNKKASGELSSQFVSSSKAFKFSTSKKSAQAFVNGVGWQGKQPSPSAARASVSTSERASSSRSQT